MYCCLLGSLLCIVSFCWLCSVFSLFWLSCQYLPSDWLERLLWGSLIVARGSSPESPGRRERMIFLVYCIASLFYYVFVLSPAPTWYIILLLWRDIAYKILCLTESAVKPQATKQTKPCRLAVCLHRSLFTIVNRHQKYWGRIVCNSHVTTSHTASSVGPLHRDITVTL